MDDMKSPSDAVALTPRLLTSGGFDLLYREGMTLIEEVAAYLDGEGRGESKGLSRDAAFLYARYRLNRRAVKNPRSSSRRCPPIAVVRAGMTFPKP